MYDAFISYSSKETDTARAVCELLEREGIPCWMAPRDIPPGTHYAGSIAQAVRNAKLMVLIFSRNSNESEQVLREVNLAVNHRLVIIPIKIDDVTPNDSMDYYLSVSHWLDADGRPLAEAAREIASAAWGLLEQRRKSGGDIKTVAPKPESDLLDIFDDEMNWIGTATRTGVHKQGIWHRTLHCWFISKEEGRLFLWAQKRSPDKADFPGLYDITAAMHLKAGETDGGGIAKIDRELGVTVEFEDTHYVGIRSFNDRAEGFYNREFNSVYLYDSPYALSDFSPNPGEVSGIVKLDIDSAQALFSGGASEMTAVGCFWSDGTRKIEKVRLSAGDFVPHDSEYYLDILHNALQYDQSKRKTAHAE